MFSLVTVGVAAVFSLVTVRGFSSVFVPYLGLALNATRSFPFPPGSRSAETIGGNLDSHLLSSDHITRLKQKTQQRATAAMATSFFKSHPKPSVAVPLALLDESAPAAAAAAPICSVHAVDTAECCESHRASHTAYTSREQLYVEVGFSCRFLSSARVCARFSAHSSASVLRVARSAD